MARTSWTPQYRECGRAVSRRLPKELHFHCDFLPVEGEEVALEDPLENQMMKENSPFWHDIQLRQGEEKSVEKEPETTENEVHEEEAPKGETDAAVGLSDAAQDLESMLKSYEGDLNCGSAMWV